MARHGLAHVEDSPTALTRALGRSVSSWYMSRSRKPLGACRLTPAIAQAPPLGRDLTGGASRSAGQPVPVVAVARRPPGARGLTRTSPSPRAAASSSRRVPPGARGYEGVLLRPRGDRPAARPVPRWSRRSRCGWQVAQRPGRLEEAGLGHRVIVQAGRGHPHARARVGLSGPGSHRLDHRGAPPGADAREPSPEALSTMTSVPASSCSRMERAARIVRYGLAPVGDATRG